MQYAIVDFAKKKRGFITAHYGHRVIRVRRPTDNNRLSTVVCRDIISEDLINLGLAMPNCLADNITGHSCDPYVFLRDRRLYLFYIANILVKRRR